MGHGTPLATGGPNGVGRAMPFMLDVGLSSTRLIAESWGLLGERRAATPVPVREPTIHAEPLPRIDRIPPPRPQAKAPLNGIQQTIEAALRSAGLMR